MDKLRPYSMQAQLHFLWEETRNKDQVLKIICIQFPPSGMLLPYLRASVAVKMIYPDNICVEQQVHFLSKWIECI